MLGALGFSFELSLNALNSLAVLYVTTARSTNQTIPFVTIPNYALHAANVLQLTNGLIHYVLPLITDDMRDQWELYAAKNNTYVNEWVNETLRYQERWEHFHGPKPQSYTWEAKDSIYDEAGTIPYTNHTPNGQFHYHVPEWQKFPLVLSPSYPAANYGTLLWFSISNFFL